MTSNFNVRLQQTGVGVINFWPVKPLLNFWEIKLKDNEKVNQNHKIFGEITGDFHFQRSGYNGCQLLPNNGGSYRNDDDGDYYNRLWLKKGAGISCS